MKTEKKLSCTELCPLQIRMLKLLTASVAVFGDRDFKEVINIKWNHQSGTLIQYG